MQVGAKQGLHKRTIVGIEMKTILTCAKCGKNLTTLELAEGFGNLEFFKTLCRTCRTHRRASERGHGLAQSSV